MHATPEPRFAPSGAESTAATDNKSTRAIAAMALPPAAAEPQATETPAPAAKKPAAVDRPAKGDGMPTWIWIVAGVVVGLVVAFFLLKGRA